MTGDHGCSEDGQLQRQAAVLLVAAAAAATPMPLAGALLGHCYRVGCP